MSEHTICQINARQLRLIYHHAYQFPIWILKFMEHEQYEKYASQCIIYGDDNATQIEIEKVALQREPVNINGNRYYNLDAMDKFFGWKSSNYNDTCSNIAIYCPTPIKVKRDDSYKETKLIHIINIIPPVINIEINDDDNEYVNEKLYIPLFCNLFKKIFECAIEKKLKNIILTDFGLGQLSYILGGGLKNSYITALKQTYTSYKPLLKQITIYFYNTNYKFARKCLYAIELPENILSDSVEKLFTTKSLWSFNKHSLYINTSNPYAIMGNGHENDNSLNGQIGRISAISVLSWPLTNPYLLKNIKKNLPVVI